MDIVGNRWIDKRPDRYSRFYKSNPYLDSPKRLIKESENFFFKKNWHEEPPVKRGLGIKIPDVLRIGRMFIEELTKAIRRKKDAENKN